jgi:protocatechuate 4,5-dioxygenase beta chain/2,3-dihydroxyphenylpropionate 1,2-dioxygenase
MLRAAIEAQDDVGRVVVLGTGGLSHWVGMREAGNINEEFDRDFLDRLTSDDPARLTAYEQKDIDAAGNGADEIRAWIVAAGAAGTGFDVLAYEPTPAWLTGTAVAAARL